MTTENGKKRGPGRPRKVPPEPPPFEVDSSKELYSFGEYIHKLRIAKNISQVDAAKIMHMPVQKLADYESGRRGKRYISIEFVSLISDTYKTPIADIIKATKSAVHNKRTLADIMTELVPATRLSELVCKRIVDESANYSADLEAISKELYGYIQNMCVLVSLLNNRHLTVDERKPLFANVIKEEI